MKGGTAGCGPEPAALHEVGARRAKTGGELERFGAHGRENARSAGPTQRANPLADAVRAGDMRLGKARDRVL
jgi:hypothetical protein